MAAGQGLWLVLPFPGNVMVLGRLRLRAGSPVATGFPYGS